MKKNSTATETPQETSDRPDDAQGGCEEDTCQMTASTETETAEDCCCCW